jgi:hypothetical protein
LKQRPTEQEDCLIDVCDHEHGGFGGAVERGAEGLGVDRILRLFGGREAGEREPDTPTVASLVDTELRRQVSMVIRLAADGSLALTLRVGGARGKNVSGTWRTRYGYVCVWGEKASG